MYSSTTEPAVYVVVCLLYVQSFLVLAVPSGVGSMQSLWGQRCEEPWPGDSQALV